ncbi:hypothetical protein OOK29_22505 [Streptomyces phaeochromogenes]|uniref:hypothetical protein n=1 Tax=Streptomyces phaeochromogenes TaxID=1923 RepID=UPI002252ACE1|nr:hypothetical protein [Streptomyces phaeochromogenes]MCX5600930.1 hypothetical protein [Streptomyces phaeochromogenes]WRZ28640.1 hypothetical protein OG931_13175 [Streptomyces phaeochromogenes]
MKPHAEIAEVWPRDGRVRLVGHIHGHPAEGQWRLLLTRRSHAEQRLDYPAQVKGDRFEGELPVADLAAATGTAEAEDEIGTGALVGVGAGVEEWDIHLTDGEVELRAGRRLDDIHGKKKIMVFPEQRVRGIGVRPYYTVKDNLSLECRTGAST